MKCHHGQLLPHEDPQSLVMQPFTPPQDLESLPRDFGPLSLCTGHLWGQGMALCIVVVKGSELSPTVLEAKAFNLLLGQTPLEMTAECGPRTECSV